MELCKVQDSPSDFNRDVLQFDISTLEVLDLSKSAIKTAQMVQLAQHLQANCKLLELKLCSNDNKFLSEKRFIVDVILSMNHCILELVVDGEHLKPRNLKTFGNLSDHFGAHFSLSLFYFTKNDPIYLKHSNTFEVNLANSVNGNVDIMKVEESCPFENSEIFTHYVDHHGGVYYYESHDVALFIPPDAILQGHLVEIKVSSSLFAPFDLPTNYCPISSYVWIGANYKFKIPVYLIMSHYAHIDSLDAASKICMLEACKLFRNEINNGRCMMKKVKCFVDADLNYCVFSTDHFCSFCLADEMPINSSEFISMYYNYTKPGLANSVRYAAEICFCYQNVLCIKVIIVTLFLFTEQNGIFDLM